MRRAISTLAACLSAAVANAEAPYPEGWPRLKVEVDGKCPLVSGRYEYRGEPGQRQNPFPNVNFDNSGFNRMSTRGRAVSAYVVHDKDAGLITVTIEGDDLSPADRVTFTRQVKCVNGRTTYAREARDFGNATVGHVNYSITQDRYGMAEDGSFIVHRSSELELRKVFGEPEKRWGEWWYRFKPRQTSDAK